ncbi:uncharacterized protein LOC123552406 [Mercenaria mercenaria]|uniref:uncharacterized protein LOC123552406 n=1 Tax=Mercenaria mercenaria TaxID=6596 RepID=UPI001E1D9B17|nr:uncharacterized protein LOC123552406 [Mercenaria mercenaria]XP_045197994.1 uncharacterized protein LOC123552406 [Mercenaria mercenaria]
MARMRRTLARYRNVITFLTTFVIVATFICFQDKISTADEAEHSAVARLLNQNLDIHDTRRSLLRFKFRRKKLKDALWTAEPILQNGRYIFNITQKDKTEILAIKVKNKLLGKNVQEFITLASETTPSVTDKPTRPITTQSDTTPIFTDSPTSPITTESITTPVVTEPGEKEVTTEKD